MYIVKIVHSYIDIYIPERSFGGQYKLEEVKNNRGFIIISTENDVLEYKAQQSSLDSIISDNKNGDFSTNP